VGFSPPTREGDRVASFWGELALFRFEMGRIHASAFSCALGRFPAVKRKRFTADEGEGLAVISRSIGPNPAIQPSAGLPSRSRRDRYRADSSQSLLVSPSPSIH
jgi:hypothetical protein